MSILQVGVFSFVIWVSSSVSLIVDRLSACIFTDLTLKPGHKLNLIYRALFSIICLAFLNLTLNNKI